MVGLIKSKWNDKKWRDIERDSRSLDGTTIAYGFPELIMHPEAKVPVAAIAKWNNNGVRGLDGSWKIPSRDFMLMAEFLAKDDMQRFNEQIRLTLGRGNSKQSAALDYVAKELGDLVREAIGDGDYKALAKSTIEGKGSDTILIESGFMYDAASGKVLKNFEGW